MSHTVNERRRLQGKAVADWYAARGAMNKVAMNRLWKSYNRSRSTAVRNTIVEQYATLAIMYASTLYSRLPGHVAWGDVQSDALVGLMRAVESFDVGRGLNFTTFAQKRIVGSCLDGLRDRDDVPRLLRSRARKWTHLLDRFAVTFGRPASDDEQVVLAGQHGLDVEQHRAAAGASRTAISLDDADELQEHNR